MTSASRPQAKSCHCSLPRAMWLARHPHAPTSGCTRKGRWVAMGRPSCIVTSVAKLNRAIKRYSSGWSVMRNDTGVYTCHAPALHLVLPLYDTQLASCPGGKVANLLQESQKVT